jgi:hypothetical protein
VAAHRTAAQSTGAVGRVGEGAQRFLILARDGEEETKSRLEGHLLVRTGETVDILLDVTNPGILLRRLPAKDANAT